MVKEIFALFFIFIFGFILGASLTMTNYEGTNTAKLNKLKYEYLNLKLEKMRQE
jgi:hypothetical protein